MDKWAKVDAAYSAFCDAVRSAADDPKTPESALAINMAKAMCRSHSEDPDRIVMNCQLEDTRHKHATFLPPSMYFVPLWEKHYLEALAAVDLMKDISKEAA